MIDLYLCDDDEIIRRQIQVILEKKILIEDYDMQIVCSTDSAGTLLGALGNRRQNIYLLDVELQDKQWDGFLLGRSCESVIPTVRWSTSPASAIWPAAPSSTIWKPSTIS